MIQKGYGNLVDRLSFYDEIVKNKYENKKNELYFPLVC